MLIIHLLIIPPLFLFVQALLLSLLERIIFYPLSLIFQNTPHLQRDVLYYLNSYLSIHPIYYNCTPLVHVNLPPPCRIYPSFNSNLPGSLFRMLMLMINIVSYIPTRDDCDSDLNLLVIISHRVNVTGFDLSLLPPILYQSIPLLYSSIENP